MLHSDYPGLEIGSVDGFQGREKEAIIISFVRCNDDHEIGFLSERRRTNVAITRARRHCCIIGNGETLGSHSFYQKLASKFPAPIDASSPLNNRLIMFQSMES